MCLATLIRLASDVRPAVRIRAIMMCCRDHEIDLKSCPIRLDTTSTGTCHPSNALLAPVTLNIPTEQVPPGPVLYVVKRLVGRHCSAGESKVLKALDVATS
jgi:hypothetical protein